MISVGVVAQTEMSMSFHLHTGKEEFPSMLRNLIFNVIDLDVWLITKVFCPQILLLNILSVFTAFVRATAQHSVPLVGN